MIAVSVLVLLAAFLAEQALGFGSMAGTRGLTGRGRSDLFMAAPLVTIGTRGSPLALAQAYETKRLLGVNFPELRAEGAVEIKKIMTKVSLRRIRSACLSHALYPTNCFSSPHNNNKHNTNRGTASLTRHCLKSGARVFSPRSWTWLCWKRKWIFAFTL